MARFQRERSDADWYLGLPVPPVVIRNIDEKTRKAWNGKGGTWAPSSSLFIGGAGLELQTTALVNASAVNPAVGKSFTFGDDDYFKLLGFDAGFGPPDGDFRVIVESVAASSMHPSQTSRAWRVLSDLSSAPRLQSKRGGVKLRVPLNLPDGARFNGTTLAFQVGVTHASIPERLPAMRVIRIDEAGVVTPFPNPVVNALKIPDADGWVPWRGATMTGAAYYASGALQNFAVGYLDTVPNVDRSKYDYAFEYREEYGAGSFSTPTTGNILWTLQSFVTINDLRPY